MGIFKRKCIVIAFTKEKVVGVAVRGKKIKKAVEFGWDEETVDIVLAKIVDSFKKRKVRILLGENLSYVVRLTIPVGFDSKKERDLIAEKLTESIPENLNDNEWDYKEVDYAVADQKEKNGDKEVIIFSPVKSFFHALSSAVKKLDIEVEAIEPEAYAKSRNANPLIGLAIKKDISGKDNDVLNLSTVELTKENSQKEMDGERLLTDEAKKLEEEAKEKKDEEKETRSELKKKSSVRTIILLIIFLVLLAVAGYFVYKNFYKGDLLTKLGIGEKIESVLPQKPEEKSGEESGEVETPTPGEEEVKEEGVVLRDYRIYIQNGSGLAGEATVVAEILEAEGFSEIETGNADSYDYVETEVRMRSGLPDEVYTVIERSLNSDYKLVRMEDFVDETSEFDVIVVVGESL